MAQHQINSLTAKRIVHEMMTFSRYAPSVPTNKIFECKTVNIFLSISFNMRENSSFEYPQNMFSLRNKEKLNYAHLT